MVSASVGKLPVVAAGVGGGGSSTAAMLAFFWAVQGMSKRAPPHGSLPELQTLTRGDNHFPQLLVCSPKYVPPN